MLTWDSEPQEELMPSAALIDQFEQAVSRYGSAANDLQPLLVRIALATIEDVLPGTHEIEVIGQVNEDWTPTLRIQRVLDGDGGVLFDVGFGHDETRVEETIDEVNIEYLDVLLDLTGDDYMGHRTIDAEDGISS